MPRKREATHAELARTQGSLAYEAAFAINREPTMPAPPKSPGSANTPRNRSRLSPPASADSRTAAGAPSPILFPPRSAPATCPSPSAESPFHLWCESARRWLPRHIHVARRAQSAASGTPAPAQATSSPGPVSRFHSTDTASSPSSGR